MTSSTFDRMIEEYENVFKISVRLIVSKIIIQRLTKELQDAIRKENYLDVVIIPKIKNQRKYTLYQISSLQLLLFLKMKGTYSQIKSIDL